MRAPAARVARMRNGLPGLLSSQGGVFCRRQALSSGYTAREFDALTRPSGPFVRVRYGVYTARDLWRSLDSAAKWQLRDRAALMVCNDQTVLSHSSAARFLKLPLYDVDDLSHVTRLGPGHGSRVQAGIKHHLAALAPDDVVMVGGVRVTSDARTVLDLSREFGYRSGLVSADAALRQGLSQAELSNLADSLDRRTHGPVMRAVARDARGGAQTPIETLGRILLTDMGITDLELQARIYFPGGGWADADILATRLRHVFETDGRLKYQAQLDRHGRAVSADEVVWMEKKREDKLRGQALGVSRIFWADTLERNFGSASTRLWSEIRAQSARLSHLPPSA